MKDKYNFIKKDALRPTTEQLLDTKLFYQQAVEIYANFDGWKDNDRFYFTPLYLEMTYTINGIVAEMSPDPVWLGSFVRCTLEHPEFFQFQCPKCGKTILPYRYVGSPLSGRVDLEGQCGCRWKGFEMVSGWRKRATALRDQVEGDKLRYQQFRLFHRKTAPATVQELIEWLNHTTE